MSETIHDVAIVGAGPAGATAALALAKRERNVVLLERDALPRSVVCSGWVSARAGDLLSEFGVEAKSLLGKPFHNVILYNADLTKTATPQVKGIPGHLIDRAEFDNALVQLAVDAGATCISERGVRHVALKESSVVLECEGEHVHEARLLVLAAGRGTPLLETLGRPRDVGGLEMWTVQASAAIESAKSRSLPRVAIVLGLDGGSSFGLCCVAQHRATVDVNWMGEPQDAVPALIQLCRRAFEHKVVPVDLSEAAAKARIMRTPASAALDMESHVRKHTLIVGDAGGFVSAVSNEGIFPAMWSAKIAAEVVNEALGSEHSQDTLMQFDSKWRMEIADHLRSPHTDIRFLLPLIFSNQPMADRMAAAFFFGENI